MAAVMDSVNCSVTKMDDLTADLAVNFQVTEFPNNPNAVHPRFSQYKVKNKSVDQEERRRRLLEQQKQQRFNQLNHLRCLVEGYGDEDVVDMSVDQKEDEIVCVQQNPMRRKSVRVYRNQLMLSEWLVDVPDNLSTEWVFVPCPVGRRSLVVTNKSSTRAYTKSGYLINEFPSHLPGGSRHQELKGKEYTILDCIFSEADRTYYVLDVMCWRGHPIFDSETEFRFYWLGAKMAEISKLSEQSSINPFRFIPLENYVCAPNELHRVLTDPLPFELDGILFYNRRTHYSHGPTPLVGWLKAYMIPEMLNVQVAEKYMKDKPAQYTGITEHLKVALKKKDKRKKKEECQMEVAP